MATVDRLTKKEKAFCEEFVANGGNASKAYFAAYDCASIENARRLYCKVFKKDKVKAYIKELQKEAFDNACINAERVALKLADIAFAGKGDEYYQAASQLKALDLLQKQLGLQTQKVEADVSTNIVINIDDD